MTDNNSLNLSYLIKSQMQKDLSSIFYEMFPFEKLSKLKQSKQRDRIYNTETTILTMLLTMINEDKSLQNSVNIYSAIHTKNKERIEALNKTIEDEYKNPSKTRRVGRPRQSVGRIAKSKRKEISEDTSAYSKARQRLALEAINEVYVQSKDFSDSNYSNHWHGLRVFIADGTYLQMQDTKEMNEKFSNKTQEGYPRGLLEVLIEQGSGAVYNFTLDSESKSELSLLSEMIQSIPEGSLLLADDLYNCFAIFSLLKEQQIEIIVPGKRVRNYKVIETISSGDEIVRIKKNKDSKWLGGKKLSTNNLLMRRISYKSIKNEKESLVLYTSLLDKEISKEEIIMKYVSRWDIEISIREIKTIMDINVVRARYPDTAYKEVISALIAYNYIRKIIVNITEGSDFSPEGDIFSKYYKNNKPIFMDKHGRKYSRWSPGRNGKVETKNTKT